MLIPYISTTHVLPTIIAMCAQNMIPLIPLSLHILLYISMPHSQINVWSATIYSVTFMVVHWNIFPAFPDDLVTLSTVRLLLPNTLTSIVKTKLYRNHISTFLNRHIHYHLIKAKRYYIWTQIIEHSTQSTYMKVYI